MPVWLVVVLVVLATHRLTRLAVEDKLPLLAWPRERVVRWLDPTAGQRQADPALHQHWGIVGRSLAYLLECSWCMSVWVGAAVVTITAQVVHGVAGWLWVLVWLAASTCTGLLHGVVESEHEQRYKLIEAQVRRAEADAAEAEASRAGRR